jgi:hypothetical protein
MELAQAHERRRLIANLAAERQADEAKAVEKLNEAARGAKKALLEVLADWLWQGGGQPGNPRAVLGESAEKLLDTWDDERERWAELVQRLSDERGVEEEANARYKELGGGLGGLFGGGGANKEAAAAAREWAKHCAAARKKTEGEQRDLGNQIQANCEALLRHALARLAEVAEAPAIGERVRAVFDDLQTAMNAAWADHARDELAALTMIGEHINWLREQYQVALPAVKPV